MASTQSQCPQSLLLLREMSHRVFNELGSAISTLSLESARAKTADVKAALDAAADRLHDYAQVHRALQMPAVDGPVDLSEHLHKVCRAIHGSRLASRGISLTLSKEPDRFDSRAMLACWPHRV